MTLLALLPACSDYALNGEDKGAAGFDSEGTFEPDTDTDEETDCPTGPLPGFPGPSDGGCASEVVVGGFDPVVEWAWTANASYPGYHQIMSTPAVGDVDLDGVPDVVFMAFTGRYWNDPGTLVMLDGATGAARFEIAGAGGHGFQSSGAVALGDLEGDGLPDICVPGSDAAVVCVEGDGTFKWAAGGERAHFGGASIADMDGDGLAEVVLGRQVFDAAGSLVGLGAHGRGSQNAWWIGTDAAFSFAVDMDGDGQLEVLAGNAVYERDGSLVWYDGGPDGFPAVADFDGDGAPEVVKVYAGTVYLTDTDGTALWSVSPGFGGYFGPPTVADFDGDGEPEIGVAGGSFYGVLEADGSTLWSVPVVDASSNMTGSAVFDFEGDGAAEVVYADEHTLWVFDGSTGDVELEEPGHASATGFEYPVIADVDADGSAEIVLGSNDSYISGWGGVRVIGDAASSWQAGRPVWNQHAYHITNVEDDLGIPAVQAENWASHNNFRSGDLATGFGVSLPDQTLSPGDVCEVDCDEGRLVVWIHPGNVGAVEAAAGSVVTLYAETGGVETELASQTVGVLPAGAFADSLVFRVEVTGPVDRLLVRIVPVGEECDPLNNELLMEGPFCD